MNLLIDMDSFYFEEKIQEYKKSTRFYNYNISSFQLLIEFYQELFSTSNKPLIEVYVTETVAFFKLHLKLYSCYGRSPEFSDAIISLAEGIIKSLNGDDDSKLIRNNVVRIISERKNLQTILEGHSILQPREFSISFLVTEKNRETKKSIGIVESLSISINKNKKTDQIVFNIVPSLPKIEEKLQRQIDDSWKYAANYLKSKYNKNIPNLEITIRFVNNLGIYEGDSLGLALTIGFIEELFAFFDFRERLIFSNDIITTGPNDANGKVKGVSKSIIEIKSMAAFYSKAKIFVLPMDDFSYAEQVINKEKRKFPDRKLEIIPVKNISDILNRRDLLVVKNQNLLKWGGKRLIKNKISLSLFIVLVSLVITFLYLYQDNNPYQIDYSKNSYLVKNQYGKILWEKETNVIFSDFSENILSQAHRIIDYNDDGENEVLFTDDIDHSLKFYTSSGEIIWERNFSYSNLRTANETFTNTFGNFKIIEIEQYNNEKIVIAYISHSPYYPTAIVKYKLDSGIQFEDLLWHTGGITGGLLFDTDNDGKVELLCTGINNGFGRAMFFAIDTDSLKGQSPKIKNYAFDGLENAKFKHYILLPKPDYFRYFFPKYDKTMGISLDSARNIIQMGLVKHNHIINDGNSVSIRFNLQLEPREIIVSDKYAIARDELVKEGKLPYPLTDTDEYREILMNQIEYWNGEKFIKFNNKE